MNPTKAPMSVTARAFFYVQQVELLVRRRVDEALAPESITAGQYMVLNLIVHHEPVSSAALARQANMTAQSMGEFIKTLEVRGWVTRSTDPSNRRVIRIGSTPEGRSLLVRCESRIDRVEREFFECLSADEVANLRFLLSRVRGSHVGTKQD